jgi:hypothetical protein
LNAAVNNAVGQKQTDLLQGQGFLSFQQKQNCTTQSGPANSANKSSSPLQGPGGEQYYQVCDLVNTTPGTIIQNALIGTENSTLNSLNLAKSFDEIISALITQLMTRTLQSGLSNLSGTGGYSSNFYSPDQLQAQSQADGLLTQLQGDTSIAGQYASVQQGSIGDIQTVQLQLNNLYNCWNSVAASSTNSTAATRAANASSTIASLNTTVNAYNNRITLANNAIVLLSDLQSRAMSANSTGDINSIAADYGTDKAAGKIPTQTDVTNAQQNRTTLQSQMNTLSQNASAELQQCNAQ